MRQLKVLAGPVNYANQAMVRTRALQARGHDAHHVLYDWGGAGVRYGFDRDEVVEMSRQNWLEVQLSVLGDALREGFEIYELRNRSLVYPPGDVGFFSGFDLPYLKASGARVVYGFTGYDLRRKSIEMEKNPHSPWHHGLDLRVDEERQLRYLEHLRQWVDCFVVTDPEMQSYLPEAKIIPRAVDLTRFDFVGVERTQRPLVVHAPSDRVMKGTDDLIRAVEELTEEGLDFEFKLIEQMDHQEAAEWYRRADVIVDQLRIGWYGVAAVEGMALGKPVIAYLLETPRARMQPEVPVVNATPETIKKTLADIVRDADRRLALATRSRAFAEEVHDIAKVVQRLEQLYYGVLDQSAQQPEPRPPEFATSLASEQMQAITDALRYANLRSKQLPELVRKARLYDELQEAKESAAGGGEAVSAPAEEPGAPAPATEAEDAPREAVPASAADRDTSVPESAQKLRVCILSRKRLSRITRIVRQARVLLDAGHEVAVVCLEKPVGELTATVPEVEWIELEVDPWTRRYGLRKRRAFRERATRRKQRLARTSGGAKGILRGAYRVSDLTGRFLTLMFLALPASVLLAGGEKAWRARLAELRRLDRPRLLALLMQPFAQRAVTTSFAEKASVALAGREFDICQAHDNYSLLAARRLARETGAHLVYDAVEISEHRVVGAAAGGGLLRRLAEWRERRQETAIIKRDATATLSIGDGVATWYERRYRIPRPAVVRNCRNYWPYERRLDIRRDCGVSARDVLVVWFGYAYPQQGLEAIVEAAQYTDPSFHFALLADTVPRWEDFYEEIKERARTLGIVPRVHFLPARDPNELISYVSGADIGIIPRPNVGPNVNFSLPNKFMEMVMARLPIVVSDLVDMRQLIEEYEIGAVCDVTDPRNVASALATVAGQRYRMHDALEQAARDLSWENEGERYLELIGAVAAAGPRSSRARVPARRERPQRSVASAARRGAGVVAAGMSHPTTPARRRAASGLQSLSLSLVSAARGWLADELESPSVPMGPSTAGAVARMSRLLSSQAVSKTEEKMYALDLLGAERVLVAGAGDGIWPLVLADANDQVAVLEHRAPYLELAGRLVDAVGAADRIVFTSGQADDADFPEATFDLVVSDRTLMHLDHERAVANFARWLEPDGRVYVSYASVGTRLQLVASSFARGDLKRVNAELRILLSDAAFRCGLGRIPRSQGRALTPEELSAVFTAYGLSPAEAPGLHGGSDEFAGYPGNVDFLLAKDPNGPTLDIPSGSGAPWRWLNRLDELLRAGLPHLVLRELRRADPDFRHDGAYALLVKAAIKADRLAELSEAPRVGELGDPYLAGLWLQAQGEDSGAIEAYRSATDAPDAAFMLGLAYLTRRELGSARRAFEADLAADPSRLRARAGLASVALAVGEPKEAFGVFSELIRPIEQPATAPVPG